MVDKELLKAVIVENQRELPPPDLIPREVPLKEPWKVKAAKVVVGPRRAGKTYYLYQIMAQLMERGHSREEFIYLNFEDNRLVGFTSKDFEKVFTAYKELFGERRPIFFLDEVHNVAGWEHFVRRLVDYRYQVYVTGSNAHLLSGEYATVLGGRYVKLEVWPFSFREYVRARGLSLEEPHVWERRWDIVGLFKEVLTFGSFPEVALTDEREAKVRLLQSYYESAIYRDVVRRYPIEDERLLEFIVKKVAENVTNPYSFSSIERAAKEVGLSPSLKTVSLYYSYLVNAFFFIHVPPYRESVVKKEKERKTYFVDNGYLHLFYVKENWDKRLENFVAVELVKKGYTLYYYRGKHEVDILAEKDGRLYAFQVTYNFEKSVKGELSGLREVMGKLSIERAYLLTFNDFGGDMKEELVEDLRKKVEIMPAWRWALGKRSAF